MSDTPRVFDIAFQLDLLTAHRFFWVRIGDGQWTIGCLYQAPTPTGSREAWQILRYDDDAAPDQIGDELTHA